MKKVFFNPILFSIILINTQYITFGQEDSVQNLYQQVTLERTEVRSLYSETVPQEYEIYIGLPASYKTKDTLYPVIYILDPYRAFSMIKGYVDLINYPHATIPEVILVGIGYGGKEEQGMLNFVVGRTRDYTPVKDQAVEEYWENLINSYGNSRVDFQTGGAALFLDLYVPYYISYMF